MRLLVVTRGAMGAGKSTWIKNAGLEQYTISPDQIRLMIQTPVMNETGGFSISVKNEKRVWNLLFEVLEDRMKRGEFTVIDATHSKTEDFKKYKKLLEKYRYRMICVDFTDVPIEKAKEQNRNRESYKFVPEDRIDNLYERFKTQEVPNWVKVIKPSEYEEAVKYTPRDLSSYKKIHHIGDIHGCYEPLLEYFKSGLKDDEFYIFTGDYIDRGIQNAEVLNWLFSIKDRDNVILLEGNHEKWLWYWANEEQENIRSREFKNITQKELEQKGVDKKETRQLYRKLHQIVYYTYGNKQVIVTHGGITTMPENLLYIATNQFIDGVGSYELDVDRVFFDNTGDNIFQIHGHRNIQRFPVQVNERCFNLEGQIEHGEYLRIVTLDEDGFKTNEIKNNVFSNRFTAVNESNSTNEAILKLKNDKTIIEKNLGDGIVSFNFSSNTFKKGKWNKNNLQARGLFVNLDTEEIVARSYNKFFNVNERYETKIDTLGRNLKYPVDIYLKENGFLGLVGYNSVNDEVVFCSKSTTKSDFAGWLKEIFIDSITFNNIDLDTIKTYLKDNNCTLVFEVIDPQNDPHIIEYQNREIVLLDIVKRTFDFQKEPYETVQNIAQQFGFKCKEKVTSFTNWNEFYNWYTNIKENKKLKIEGYVLEDASGFMTKIKLPYYGFWKHMRKIKEILSKKNPVFDKKILFSKSMNEVYNWMITKDKDYLQKSSIIQLRNDFYKEVKNPDFEY